MIPNPVKMDSQNFQCAITGISRLVDELVLFGRKSSSDMKESPVNGNTILNMFSEWLFEASVINKPG